MTMSQDSLHQALSYLPIQQRCSRCTTYPRTDAVLAKSFSTENQLTSYDLHVLTVRQNMSMRFQKTLIRLSVRTVLKHSPELILSKEQFCQMEYNYKNQTRSSSANADFRSSSSSSLSFGDSDPLMWVS